MINIDLFIQNIHGRYKLRLSYTSSDKKTTIAAIEIKTAYLSVRCIINRKLLELRAHHSAAVCHSETKLV